MNLIAEILPVLHNLLEWLAIASLKTIPLIVLIFALQRLFRKQLSAAAMHLLWLSVLLSLSIPFGWDIHLDSFTNNHSTVAISSAQHIKNSDVAISLPEIAIVANDITTSTSNVALEEKSSWLSTSIHSIEQYYRLILTCIWLSGVIVLLCLTGLSMLRFQRIKINSVAASTDLSSLLKTCQQEIRLHKNIQLLCAHEIQSPITLGWLRPAIVLPHNIETQFCTENIKHVLLHELGHIKRNDILFNWAACLINILHWFNPAVWIACRQMRMDMEMACDALVLNHLPPSQRKNYGATLIEISEIPRTSRQAIITLGILENHTELTERLKMIKEFTTMKLKNTLLFGTILMATALTALAQPATSPSVQPAAAMESKTASPSGATISLQEFAARAEKDLKIKMLFNQNEAEKRMPANLSKEPMNYGQLLTQLKINGLTAYKSKDYIQIVALDEARNLSIPTVEKGKTYYEDEVVTDYIKLEKACVNQVLAQVRPLVPRYGHLSAFESSSTLIIVDTYENIQRIRSVIKMLEEGINKPMSCPAPDQSPKK